MWRLTSLQNPPPRTNFFNSFILIFVMQIVSGLRSSGSRRWLPPIRRDVLLPCSGYSRLDNIYPEDGGDSSFRHKVIQRHKPEDLGISDLTFSFCFRRKINRNIVSIFESRNATLRRRLGYPPRHRKVGSPAYCVG